MINAKFKIGGSVTCEKQATKTLSSVHVYEGLYEEFSDRYLGHLNRNKNTSEFLTLPPCLIYGMFLAFLAVSARFIVLPLAALVLIERENSEPTTLWNSAEMAKTLTRYREDKVRQLCSIHVLYLKFSYKRL